MPTGNEYIDGTSGAISVASVGHGRREVADAIHAQVLRMDYVHDNEFHNEPAHALAAKVTEFAGGDFSHAVFFSSGSEAVESAIKLAHNYHALNGEPARNIVIGRKRSFHGATMYALGVGDVAARKSIYQGYMALPTAKIPAPYCYRCPLGRTYPDCALACARELERTIKELGPENVSAFIAEPVVGAAAPALTPPAGYYEAIREICDRYGVLWIADEIVTGFGRTGRNMGYMHWDAQPDILVVAKGMSGRLRAAVRADHLREGRPPVRGAERAVHPRPDLPEPPRRLRRGARGRRASSSARASSQNAAVQGAYLEARLREMVGPPADRRRAARQGPDLGHGARRGPGHEGPVRPGARRGRHGPPRRARERPGDLPERRQRLRERRGVHQPVADRHPRRCRRDRRPPTRARSRRSRRRCLGPAAAQPAVLRPTQSTSRPSEETSRCRETTSSS